MILVKLLRFGLDHPMQNQGCLQGCQDSHSHTGALASKAEDLLLRGTSCRQPCLPLTYLEAIGNLASIVFEVHVHGRRSLTISLEQARP
jgi:hypothetical protein